MDWSGVTAAAIGRAIEAGQADPVEVAEAFLERIATHPHGARIYARTTPGRARAEAEAARGRARAGTRRGPLDGVPLSWKDLFDSAGTATEAGTSFMAGRVPEQDAAVLARASAAGTVCLGKTHMTEIAFSGLGFNPVTATPPGWPEAERLPGGSSSGAAASVAWRLAPAAVGSDTGGSVRLPAVWCGLVGFKPAHGALPLDGVVPLCPSFDTVGPIARDVEDCALLWEAMGGPRVDLAGATLAGATFGVVRDVVGEGLEEAPARAFDAALRALAQAGARLVEVALPDLPRAYVLAGPLYTAEAWAMWRERIAADPARMFPPTRERVEAGRDVLAADWIAAWAELKTIRAGAAEIAGGFDALLCPACPILPPAAAAVAADHALFRERNLMALRNTRMANLLGMASLALPVGGEASCGVLLNALPGREGALLRLGAAAMRAMA